MCQQFLLCTPHEVPGGQGTVPWGCFQVSVGSGHFGHLSSQSEQPFWPVAIWPIEQRKHRPFWILRCLDGAVVRLWPRRDGERKEHVGANTATLMVAMLQDNTPEMARELGLSVLSRRHTTKADSHAAGATASGCAMRPERG